MSAKDYALLDIQEDLQQRNKSFIKFRKELNPVMRRLVSKQIKQQLVLNHYIAPSHSNSQLVAHCFFSKNTGKPELHNYDRYYGKKN